MHAHLQLLFMLGWIVTVSVCFLAWRFGGKAERDAALLVIAISVLTVLPKLLLGKALAKAGYLTLDGALAFGLLMLAMRHAAAWLGVAVLLQAVQFSLHAYYLVSGEAYDQIYILVNNLVSLGVILSLALGAFLAWRKSQAVEK